MNNFKSNEKTPSKKLELSENDMYKKVELIIVNNQDLCSKNNLSTNGKPQQQQPQQQQAKLSDSPTKTNQTSRTETNKDDDLKFMNRYRLSFAKSVDYFFIQAIGESDKYLTKIHEQIEEENLSNRQRPSMAEHLKCPPKMNTTVCYGIRSSKDKKYYRVRLIEELKSSNEQISTSYLAFFVDYGYTDRVFLEDLILISDFIQQYAPQAICCKLYGITSSSQSSLKLVDFFRKKLENGQKTFMATIYKEYSVKNKITNFIPLQSDNTKPIEIIIHLSQNSNSILDLTNILLNFLQNQLPPPATNSPSLSIQIPKPKLYSNHIATKSTSLILPVKIVNIIDFNHFFVALSNNDYETQLQKLTNEMKLDYETKKPLVNKISLNELTNRLPFVYRSGSNSVYKRAIFLGAKSIMNNKQTSQQFKFYLIDYGTIIYVDSISLDAKDMFPLTSKYLNVEPLSVECTLDLNVSAENYALMLEKFKKFILLKNDKNDFLIRFSELNANNHYEIPKYKVNLYIKEETANLIDIGKEMTGNAKTNNVVNFLLKNETSLEVGHIFRAQLINVDTAKYFSVILCEKNEKRTQFLNKFHLWHKENRQNLKSLFDNPQKPSSKEQLVGMPVALNSIQISKWCRGVILSSDFQFKNFVIHLVDYSRNINTTHDRLFKLEEATFLHEPILVHRCLLSETVDNNPEQREMFAKYVDLIKSPAALSSTETSNQYSSPTPTNVRNGGDMQDGAHLSIDSFELEIECLKKEMRPLNVESSLISNQYCVKIIAIRRVKSPFHSSSPHYNSILINRACVLSRTSNAPKTKPNPLGEISYNNHNNNSNLMINTSSTIENVLCSTYKDNNKVNSKQHMLQISTSRANENHNNHESIYQNETFSAITESTRIHQTILNNCETEQYSAPILNEVNSSLNTITSTTSSKARRRSSNLMMAESSSLGEETSKWIKDEQLEDDLQDESKYLIMSASDLKKGQKYKVKIVLPNDSKTFTPNDYVTCQKLYLLASYERLQTAMNSYYEKIANASRSLEKNSPNDTSSSSSNSNFASAVQSHQSHQSSLSDSTDSNLVDTNDFFIPTFTTGNYCAAHLPGTKSWSRCLILDIMNNRRAVLECVDDHRKHTMPLNKMEKLSDKFKLMHRFAFRAQILSNSFEKLFDMEHLKRENFEKLKIFLNDKLAKNGNELTAEIVSIKEENENPCLKQYVYDINLLDMNERNIFDDFNI
jgi:hypothetical protein